jgi:hypothetical protein
MGVIFASTIALATACGASGGPATSAPATSATATVVAQPTSAPATRAATVVQPTAAPTSVATRAPAATTQATTAAQPTTATGPSGNPFDFILNAQRAQLAVKAFRSKTTTTSAAGTQTTTTLEYVNPDRVHLIMANGNETIVIKGVGTYSKTSGGKWAVSPVDLSSTVFGQFDPKTIEELKNSIVTSNVKLIGPDVLDGRPVLVTTYDTLVKGLGPGGSDIHGSARLWVGATDGLPYRRESTQDSAVTAGAKTTTVTTYEYDPNIKIEKPI